MQTHLEEIHWKKGFDCVCRICEEGFKVISLSYFLIDFIIAIFFLQTKGTFMQHMTVVHAKYEMPYSCSVCAYRSSFHKDVVDHFQVCLHYCMQNGIVLTYYVCVLMCRRPMTGLTSFSARGASRPSPCSATTSTTPTWPARMSRICR